MVVRDRRKVAVAEDEDHEEAGGRKGKRERRRFRRG